MSAPAGAASKTPPSSRVLSASFPAHSATLQDTVDLSSADGRMPAFIIKLRDLESENGLCSRCDEKHNTGRMGGRTVAGACWARR